MENEERIRKWRAGQQAGGSDAPAAQDSPASPSPASPSLSAPPPGPAIPSRRQEELAEAARQRDDLADSRLPTDDAVTDRAGDDQARRWWQVQRLQRRALLFVGLPVLVALVYGLILRPAEYRSDTSFVVMQASGTGEVGPAAGLLGLGSGAGLGDAYRIREYLLSREAMAEMERKSGFLSHFRAHSWSPFSRPLDLPALGIDPHDFYTRTLHIGIDMREGIVRLEVDALTPAAARRFADTLLTLANGWIARASDVPNRDQARALLADVDQARKEMRAASLALAEVQHRRGELDPEKSGAVIYQLITNLEVKLAERIAEKDSIIANGMPESPLLGRLDAEIVSLRQQITAQRNRLAGGPDARSLSGAAVDMSEAMTRLTLSQSALESSLRTYEQARFAGIQDRRYLVVVARPVAASPTRLPALLHLTGLALVLGLIAWGVAGIVRSSLFLGGAR